MQDILTTIKLQELLEPHSELTLGEGWGGARRHRSSAMVTGYTTVLNPLGSVCAQSWKEWWSTYLSIPPVVAGHEEATLLRLLQGQPVVTLDEPPGGELLFWSGSLPTCLQDAATANEFFDSTVKRFSALKGLRALYILDGGSCLSVTTVLSKWDRDTRRSVFQREVQLQEEFPDLSLYFEALPTGSDPGADGALLAMIGR